MALAATEPLVKSGDLKSAVEAYRVAIGRLPSAQLPAGKESDDLYSLRKAFIRGVLNETKSGAQAMVNAAAAPATDKPQTPDIRRWWTMGPFENGDWKCYANPPISAAAVDLKQPVGDKTWKQPEAKFYTDQAILDLKGVYNTDNCVVFCYAQIDSASEGPSSLSMGADDGLVVWLNGKKVHEDRDQRGTSPNSIQIPVILKKGVNHLLCMVQNGGGGHGIQCRVLAPGWCEAVMGQVLSLALAHPDQRIEIATALRDLAEGSYQSGRVTEASDMTRLLLRAFPDCWDLCSSLAWNFTRDDRRAQDPVLARQALIWEEATAPMKTNGDYTASWLGDVRNGAANVLVQIGDLETSIEFNRLAQWAYFDIPHQANMWLYLGQRFLDGGYQDRAAQYFKRLLALDSGAPVEPWILNQARDYLALLRGLKNTSRPLAMSFDSVLALRLAERSIEEKDYQRAINGFQQAIANSPGQVVPISGGRYQGLAMWCAERMRNFPQAGVDAYRASQGTAATQAMAQAATRDDIDAMERVACLYPISAQAVDAFIWLAKRYVASGADALAASTIQRLVTDFALAESVQSQLLSIALRSAAKSGQRRMFAELAADFTAIANPVVDGAKVDAKTWVKEAGAPLAIDESDHKAVAAIGVAPLTMLPEQLRDIRRFVKDGARTVHMVPRAGVGSGMAYVHTGIDGVLMDLATGAVRWRTESARDADRLLTDGGFTGMPDAGSIIAVDRCVTRVRRDGRWCLEARDIVTGKVAWSSAGIPELAGMNACSSPASDGVRVLALFNNPSTQLAAVAFCLSDGHLSWYTALPVSAGVGGLYSISEAGFNLAAPTISGRDAYVVNEGGSVLAIDAASGFVRWISSYANAWGNVYLGGRTAIERLSRPVSRVVVQNNRLYVLPKDTLGLLCLSQVDGSALWRCDFPYGRALTGVAMTRAGERIVLQGNDVRGFDALTGRLVWQWKPLDGATIGIGTMNSSSVTVATALSLNRLSTETGALLESTPWKNLGITGSAPGNLQWVNDRLIACGNTAQARAQVHHAFHQSKRCTGRIQLHIKTPPSPLAQC